MVKKCLFICLAVLSLNSVSGEVESRSFCPPGTEESKCLTLELPKRSNTIKYLVDNPELYTAKSTSYSNEVKVKKDKTIAISSIQNTPHKIDNKPKLEVEKPVEISQKQINDFSFYLNSIKNLNI